MGERLPVRIGKSALRYLEHLDQTMQGRIRKKFEEIAVAPFDVRHSKPLTASNKRSARVGDYRILFLVVDETVVITEIDARGGVYRNV